MGFLVANVKKISDAKIGDTITEVSRVRPMRRSRLQELKPMVFAGLYPVEGHQYPELRDALEKLRLNDACSSTSRKRQWRSASDSAAGSFGLLHMEIVQNVSNASSTWTWSRPHQASCTRDDDRRRSAGDRQPGEAAGCRPHRED